MLRCLRLSLTPPPRQVIEDARSSITDTLDKGTEAEIEKARENWKSRALTFLKRSAVEPDPEAPAKKKFRLKSRDWLAYTEHQLETACGKSWEDFVIPKEPEKRLPLDKWPVITLSADRGPDGEAACNFLRYAERVCMLRLPDDAHWQWDTAIQALKDSKLWGWAMVMMTVINADHGPWEEARWYQSGREAVVAYKRLLKKEPTRCPIFTALLEPILRDQGEEHRKGEEGIARIVWDGLEAAWAKKAPKVAPSRWFGLIKSLHDFLPLWHRRLLTNLYLCYTTGLKVHADKNSIIKEMGREVVPETVEPEDSEKQSTGREHPLLRRLRKASKNTLQLQTTILADEGMRCLSKVVTEVFSPLELGHGVQVRDCKSVGASAEWYQKQATGDCLATLSETLQRLSNPKVLSDIGFSLSTDIPGTGGGPIVDPLHPALAQENKLATLMGELTRNLAANMLHKLLWHAAGFPGCLVALLSAKHGPPLLERMRMVYKVWHEKLPTWPGSFWKQAKKRSVFQDQFVVRSFELARAADWTWSPDLASKVGVGWESMGGTTAVEHAMRELRQLESHKSGWKKLASNKRKFECLIDSSVLSELHSYRPVDWESQVVPRGRVKQLTEAMFVTKVAKIPAFLNNIVSESQATPWYSPRPLHMMQQTLDIIAATRYATLGFPEKARNFWLACLFRQDPVVYWRPPDSQKYLCIGEYYGQAAIGWPVTEHNSCGLKLFAFKEKVQFCDLAITFVEDAESIRCYAVEWTSPAALSVASELAAGSAAAAASSPELGAGVFARACGEAGSLRCIAAQRCFGDIKVTQLRLLAKEFGLEVASNVPLLGVLKVLLKASLPGLSPNDLLRILSMRLSVGDPWENFLDIEIGLDSEVLDDPLHREWKDELQEREADLDDFKKDFEKEAKGLRPKPKKKGNKNFRPKFSDTSRDADLDHELPPGWRIWGDTYNSRYQLSRDGYRILSRSWQLYGKVEAANLCLDHAWTEHIRLGGNPPQWWES